jgi:uracil-DNA glycosylase
MRYIVFVGDKPSSKNVSKSVPFVGTQSYKNLLEWIWKMDVDITNVMLANREHVDMWFMCADDESRLHRHTYVALGNEASEALQKFKLDHFKLPHPSPRNRQLNDQDFIDSELKKCKDYLKRYK